jgi:hypothetical protein
MSSSTLIRRDAGILILAANTAFNGFPVLASILADHRYLPRQLHTRVRQLVSATESCFSAGSLSLSSSCFDANIDRLIQLYIIGVFTSFTLSQAGMVRHWNRTIPLAPACPARTYAGVPADKSRGAVVTAAVLVIVLCTKVVHGAWIAIVAMGVLFALMKSISRHYRAVSDELRLPVGELPQLPSNNHAVVLVSRLHLPTMRAISYAKATRPSSLKRSRSTSIRPIPRTYFANGATDISTFPWSSWNRRSARSRSPFSPTSEDYGEKALETS